MKIDLTSSFMTPAHKLTSEATRRKTPETKPKPFSLRLTFEERAALEDAAGEMPLGAFIRSRLLGDQVEKPRRKRRAPVEDKKALGQVLGELGKSRIANNLNQMARAVNSGSLHVTPEAEAAILEACADVRHMRMELLKALGVQQEPSP